MAKPELEFFAPDRIPWQPVAGSVTGGAGGPGVETRETIVHDFWEEVWILDGELVDLGKGQTFTAGMYACRRPGMVHGPYRVPRGCTTLELRYGKSGA